MADTAKQLKRGYKRNFGTIQAMIAEYQKATGKTAINQFSLIQTDKSKPIIGPVERVS